MDEPSIGLHPRDVGRLVRVMHNLRDKGNTLLVVEHEEQIIHAADNLIDIGPGRGEHGGELVWSGTLDQFVNGAGAPARRTMGGKPARWRAGSILDARLSDESQINSGPDVAANIEVIDQDHWRTTAQPEEHRRRSSAWSFHMCHRRFWVWKIHADPRRALPESGGREGRVV